MEKQSDVIMFNSDEAAQYKTDIQGWVSRNGIYFGGDERTARYDGCTHRLCEDCGEPIVKAWLVCSKCSEIRNEAKYKALPKEVWNEVGMIYSEYANMYFASWSEVEDYCRDEDIQVEKLRLLICDPVYLPLLDYTYGCDELPEDAELPGVVIKAIEDFNKVIKTTSAVAWYPSNRAAI